MSSLLITFLKLKTQLNYTFTSPTEIKYDLGSLEIRSQLWMDTILEKVHMYQPDSNSTNPLKLNVITSSQVQKD